MKPGTLLVCAAMCAALPGAGWSQAQAPYTAAQVERFVGDGGVDFPVDYQVSLVEDVIRETKGTFKSVEILREGEALPAGKPVLRITGVITRFKPGSRLKRSLIGFGVGATVVKARVKFTDAASGQVLHEEEVEGVTVLGLAGGSSESAAGRLARKIVGLAKSKRLLTRT